MTLTPDQIKLIAHMHYAMTWDQIKDYIQQHSGNRIDHVEECPLCVKEEKPT